MSATARRTAGGATGRTILVRTPNWIGDQILAFPFFWALRALEPAATIVATGPSWVASVQFRGLIDAWIELPRARGTGLWQGVEQMRASAARLRAWSATQGVRWDRAWVLPRSFSSAWVARAAGARERIGHAGDGRSWFLTQALPWSDLAPRHRAQAYVELLGARGSERVGDVREFWGRELEPEDADTGLGAGSAGAAHAERVGARVGAFDAQTHWGVGATSPATRGLPERYWVLAPGATAESRRWEVARFARLAERIHAETGWVGVLVGGPQEAVAAQECVSQVRPGVLIDRTACGSVAELAPLFARAPLTVANESGLAHVAALCSRSDALVQIVCGAANPVHTRPLGPARVQVSVNPVECWPCERNTCSQPAGRWLQCLRGIEPDGVWEEIQSWLKRVS